MAAEKSFLQSIKLDISRTFKLSPYERLAFHKILGIAKSETGSQILLRELQKGTLMRRSAILSLVNYNENDVRKTLVNLLGQPITESEKIIILDYLLQNPGVGAADAVFSFIDKEIGGEASHGALARGFRILQTIGEGDSNILEFLTSKITDEDIDSSIKGLAIEALASFNAIGYFEEIVKKGDEHLCFSAYKAIYEYARVVNEKASRKNDEERIFTYSEKGEEKSVLDIRVLLGKMTNYFDSYSNRTKIAFICAMISSNHREYLIYVMKALTSKDIELAGMTLYILYQNVELLTDPDKLFRSLIALSIENQRFNELIVAILYKYFSADDKSRQFNILQDKLYGYIVVTLETYFETYRKEFMITDVIEKGLPESFQRIRDFILKYGNPDIKKEIINHLNQEEPSVVRHVVDDMGKWISFIEEEDRESLHYLFEILLDDDIKSRENSASRIEDLRFEKLYLRNRIVRLCRLIGLLEISEASTALVNIYNYLKKYSDPRIMEAVIHTLSILNYSYMLGEIEVMINTGNEEDQKKALELISLFTEQRSLNILLELLKNRMSEESFLVEKALEILLDRDISGNVTANQILKGIIDNSGGSTIRSYAILGIGQCGMEPDIEFLNTLFFKLDDKEPKDVVVRAIGDIVYRNDNIHRRQLIKYLQEYLKDPGIRVRIYSCLLLIRLGDTNAIRSIREMLIIKNKDIQRDILTIIGDLKSIEFSFFILSLLKEEYGISRDIISLIKRLPEDEIREINGFIVNLFQKYEAPDMEGMDSMSAADPPKKITLEGAVQEQKTLLNIELLTAGMQEDDFYFTELINLNLKLKYLILSIVKQYNGVIAKLSKSDILIYFDHAIDAANAASGIEREVGRHNNSKTRKNHLRLNMHLYTGMIYVFNGEIVHVPVDLPIDMKNVPMENRVLVDGTTGDIISDKFSLLHLPSIAFPVEGQSVEFYEIEQQFNYNETVDSILKDVQEKLNQKEQMQQKLEEEMRMLRRKSRSTSSVAVARELENIGQKLQEQLNEIEGYVQRRSTDRELINNVRKMLKNTQNMYKVEISRIIID